MLVYVDFILFLHDFVVSNIRIPAVTALSMSIDRLSSSLDKPVQTYQLMLYMRRYSSSHHESVENRACAKNVTLS